MPDMDVALGGTNGSSSSSSSTPLAVSPKNNYVGLVNQGATCYMNSLLQALFHLTVFREGIFTLPRDEDRVVSALQQLFYRMEESTLPVSTEALTQSFGWDSYEAYRQHDVQELLQVLVTGHIESCFKKNSEKGTDIISKHFRGFFTSYIRVTDPEIEYENSVDEPYIDIQLNVKNFDKTMNSNLHECFRSFIVEDQLNGNNKYELEKDGSRSLHDAVKGMKFKSFPNILILHLKRFCQDLYGRAEKVSDEVQFEDELDLSEFCETNEDNTFVLHAVMVHRGSTATMGHYYSFVKVDQSNWYKFDDSRVSKCTSDDAIRENYGTSSGRSWSYGYASAYLLVYLRKSQIDQILLADTQPRRCSLLTRQLREKMTEEVRRRSPNEYAEIVLLTSEDYKERIETNPLNIDCFRDVNYKGAGRRFYCEKKKGIQGLKTAVVDSLEVPDKLLSEMQLFKCTQTGLVLVDDDCYGVGSRLDPGVFYIHPPSMKVNTTLYKKFTFLVNFENKKMHPHPEVITPQLSSYPSSLGNIVVCYTVEGHAVPTIENLLVCVIEAHESSSFHEHQRLEQNKKVLCIPPVEHQSVIPFRHESLKFNVLKTDELGCSDLKQMVSERLSIPIEFIKIKKTDHTVAQFRYEILDFETNLDPAKITGSMYGSANRVYVNVFGNRYDDFFGCFTVIIGGEPTSNDVESALTQLPKSVLEKLPDGKLFVTNMQPGISCRSMMSSPCVFCVRAMPQSRLSIEIPKHADHIQCCHFNHDKNEFIGMPFPVHITTATTPSELLKSILEFIGISPWTGPTAVEPLCQRADAPIKPFPVKRRDFKVEFPKSFPEDSDGSDWTLIPLVCIRLFIVCSVVWF